MPGFVPCLYLGNIGALCLITFPANKRLLAPKRYGTKAEVVIVGEVVFHLLTYRHWCGVGYLRIRYDYVVV